MDGRRTSGRVAGAAILATLLSVAIASPAYACENTTASAVRANTSALEVSVLCLVNEERSRRGLRTLRADVRLDRAAAAHARDMVERDYFAHVSPGGRDLMGRLNAHRYTRSGSWKAGENIAWGTGRLGTPRSIVRMWMHSPGHRALILERSFTEGGVGVAPGAPGRRTRDAGTYVIDFGRP
jgi:uncharacterized protein YkwD